MIDRLIARLLFAGFVIAAALGWDWDRRADDADQRAQQNMGEIRGVVGRGVHNGSSDT